MGDAIKENFNQYLQIQYISATSVTKNVTIIGTYYDRSDDTVHDFKFPFQSAGAVGFRVYPFSGELRTCNIYTEETTYHGEFYIFLRLAITQSGSTATQYQIRTLFSGYVCSNGVMTSTFYPNGVNESCGQGVGLPTVQVIPTSGGSDVNAGYPSTRTGWRVASFYMELQTDGTAVTRYPSFIFNDGTTGGNLFYDITPTAFGVPASSIVGFSGSYNNRPNESQSKFNAVQPFSVMLPFTRRLAGRGALVAFQTETVNFQAGGDDWLANIAYEAWAVQ